MLYERIDVFRKSPDSAEIVIYRCWRMVSRQLYFVQSADRVRFPPLDDELRAHELRMLQLFSELAPEERSEGFASLEDAISAFDAEFENDWTE